MAQIWAGREHHRASSVGNPEDIESGGA
jgi:hypothetical protein